MNRKILIPLCLAITIAMTLVGYTIGNLTFEPRVKYVDRIEYVDRVINRTVEYLPRNTWQINFGYYFQSETIPTSNGTIGLTNAIIENGEYASQNATIRFEFHYDYPENITHFGYGIAFWGEVKDGRLNTTLYERITLGTVELFGEPLQQGDYWRSKKIDFTTPDHIGTYIIQIWISMRV